ncbi:unnamed protein product [Hermetia illucens]|uniref:Uncharacterized protein n=1 Tax=Hermetia illucens TaxID=343691 RepID=A0A7R8YM51_HERIL|nr:unnamed protein product [Hermetia illucens]
MDFNEFVADAIEDSVRTAEQFLSISPYQAQEVFSTVYKEGGGEKSDLPEKHYCDLAFPREPASCSIEGETVNSTEEDSDKSPREIVDNDAENVSRSFLQLVENSEDVFNGFEELLDGSAKLLDEMGRLFRASQMSIHEGVADGERIGDQPNERPGKPDHDSSDEGSDPLTPLISLTALQKASDLEKERILQLQEQIKAMNDNIRETDMFIKKCQKINDDLDEECRKIESCTCANDAIFANQITELQMEVTSITEEQVLRRNPQSLVHSTPRMGDYQTADASAPNFDRWSMLYSEPNSSCVEQAHVPFIPPSMNFGEGEPHRIQYYAGPSYDELESISESDEEEELTN